jgi:hypothetical protein
MRLTGNWLYVVVIVFLAIGVSGVIEALPHASESAGDLLIDAALLALIVAGSILAARILKARRQRATRG